mmetsp:Transcript_64231/g.144986  ORF Transcript_64231/g.144986 Transcript_64231/m.144986 type:complete len:252 (-) Transcript_64231:158-913(-)
MAASPEPYNKKIWNFNSCLADHLDVLCSLPKILDAYAGCNSVSPKLNESIMVTVNSVNNCPYCTGLHGELARMAGVTDHAKLMCAKSTKESVQVVDEADRPGVSYARVFAESDGRGQAEAEAYAEVDKAYGAGRAASIKALCWFLLWGSTGGNTVNAFIKGRLRGAPKPGSSCAFELIFFIYYGPLFLLIALVNALLPFFPRVPAWFSAAFGVLLAFIASVWIIPVGVLGAFTKPCRPRSEGERYASLQLG